MSPSPTESKGSEFWFTVRLIAVLLAVIALALICTNAPAEFWKA